jgi:hypothetical protein
MFLVLLGVCLGLLFHRFGESLLVVVVLAPFHGRAGKRLNTSGAR